MRKNIVAGNWKMNTTLPEGLALAKGLDEALKGKTPNCDVIIGTPFTHLASVAAAIDTNKIGVAAENCADKEKGAYTGEVSADGCFYRCKICDPGPLRKTCLLSRNSGNPENKG